MKPLIITIKIDTPFGSYEVDVWYTEEETWGFQEDNRKSYKIDIVGCQPWFTDEDFDTRSEVFKWIEENKDELVCEILELSE